MEVLPGKTTNLDGIGAKFGYELFVTCGSGPKTACWGPGHEFSTEGFIVCQDEMGHVDVGLFARIPYLQVPSLTRP